VPKKKGHYSSRKGRLRCEGLVEQRQRIESPGGALEAQISNSEPIGVYLRGDIKATRGEDEESAAAV